MKSARERMDMHAAYREVGTYRAAAEICGTTPKTVKRAVLAARAAALRTCAAGPANEPDTRIRETTSMTRMRPPVCVSDPALAESCVASRADAVGPMTAVIRDEFH